MKPSRNLEDVESTLTSAKINRAGLSNISQELSFSNDRTLDEYKLLEINDEILRHVENGGRLTIRGEENDQAVVCSDSKTYSVREAEISNVILLLPRCKFFDGESTSAVERTLDDCQVIRMFHTYWETKEESIFPHKKLRACLSEVPYYGPEKELDQINNKKGKLYSFADLLEKIPSSEGEIRGALKLLRVFELDGKIRLLDFNYVVRLTTAMLNFIEENSWSWKEIDFDKTIDTLSSLEPKTALKKWFNLFAKENKTNGGTWSLLENEICKLFAEIILNAAEKISLRDFTDAWRQSVPDGMKPELSMLRGLAVVEMDAKSPYIQLMRTDTLSDDPVERLEQLFKKRQRWTQHEIAPFLEDLLSHKNDVTSVLAKHCRCSTAGDKKIYTSKVT